MAGDRAQTPDCESKDANHETISNTSVQPQTYRTLTTLIPQVDSAHNNRKARPLSFAEDVTLAKWAWSHCAAIKHKLMFRPKLFRTRRFARDSSCKQFAWAICCARSLLQFVAQVLSRTLLRAFSRAIRCACSLTCNLLCVCTLLALHALSCILLYMSRALLLLAPCAPCNLCQLFDGACVFSGRAFAMLLGYHQQPESPTG